ncbi:flagellar biosynthesis/type III secretory pathway protein FliH [Bradyrhizobium sp. LM4.3]
MGAPAKFLFDNDFAAPDRTREKAATAAEIAQKVAEAEARAYQDGFAAGQREAKAESDRRVALANGRDQHRNSGHCLGHRQHRNQDGDRGGRRGGGGGA